MTIELAQPANDLPPAITARLGDMLLDAGLVTPDQVEVALHESRRSGKLLGECFVTLGFISHEALNDVLASRTGYANWDASLLIDPDIAARLPRALAEQHRILALGTNNDGIVLGMVDPYDIIALDAARRHFNGNILIPMLLTASDHAALCDQVYEHKFDLPSLLRELQEGRNVPSSLMGQQGDALRHPVVRLLNTLLIDAIRAGASDLHIEPEEFTVRIRRRQDGVLRQVAMLHRDFWSPLLHRLKIMAGMNIANRLVPQDGRFTLTALGRTVDCRAATLPGIHGENITVRLLDKKRALLDLATLGFDSAQQAQLRTLISKPEGLVILTGPTGSGKTTTLYAMLSELADIGRNIMTLEDPVEYQLPLLRQTQIREATGLGFAEGVRAILRQAPNVILIGEIRDAETAQMAVRAAMTGHLVFTTLHTRDVFGVVPRLLDFGLAPSLLAGNLNGIMAQRLLRQLCDDCKTPYAHDNHTLYKAVGCAHCDQTGYRGRLAIGEIFTFDESHDDLLLTGNGSRSLWQEAARTQHMPRLADAARQRLLDGFINIAEFERITGQTYG